MARSNIKKPVTKTQPKTRKLKPAKPKLLGLSPGKKYRAKIPSGWSIFKQSLKHIWNNKKLFIGISAVYLVLVVLFARGFKITTDLDSAKQSVDGVFNGSTGTLASAFTIFGYILGNSGPSDNGAAVYQLNIIVLTSLAIIWALRQTYASQKVSIKDVFYKSTYPLVPFILTLVIVALQAMPWVVGSFLFNTTVVGGVARGFLQIGVCLIASFGLLLWSTYMITASLFAVYIVTLSDMKPLQALRAAKKLVEYRRWTVLRRLLFLPLILALLFSVTMILIIIVLAPISEVLFLILSSLALVVFHSYIYSLYRELL